MSLTWTCEAPAYWNDDKARVVGAAPTGVFDARFMQCTDGDILPGDWWRVEDDGAIVGYGWLDITAHR